MNVIALWEEVERWSAAPFDLGIHDCCLFTARCLDACHGTDFTRRLEQEYSDERGAVRFIARHGGLVPAVSTFLGELREGLPRRGDAALVPAENGPGGVTGVGICLGESIAVAAERGIVQYPLAVAKGHWRV